MTQDSQQNAPLTSSGKLLWQLLPEAYRNWDGTYGKDPRQPDKVLKQRGDLANYLDAYGVIFDQVKNTISQRLADISPETCQDWLIPYFADLLDVHLVSPDIEGQRQEVAKAISWRQRKGTMGCSKEIVQEVGRYEELVRIVSKSMDTQTYYQTVPTVVIHEGFRRVATTARIGIPLVSLFSLGINPDEFNENDAKESPIHNALRPGLTAGTVDFRYLSRAAELSAASPAGQTHAFESEGVYWQQKYPRGMPCYLDGYQDASVRTVDVRTPGWNQGHYHPARTLVYAKPREGFFSSIQFTLQWNELAIWYQLFDSTSTNVKPFVDGEDTFSKFRQRSLDVIEYNNKKIILIERIRYLENDISNQRIIAVRLDEVDTKLSHRTEIVGDVEHYLQCGFEINEENITNNKCKKYTLRGFGEVTPSVSLNEKHVLSELTSTAVTYAEEYIVENLVMNGELEVIDAPIKILKSAIKKLSLIMNEALDERFYLLVNIVDSLMDEVIISGSSVNDICRLEYSTILKNIKCDVLEISDSILLSDENVFSFNKMYMRYSDVPSLPEGKLGADKGIIYEQSMTRSMPLFLNSESEFGDAGYGVLHPACVELIRQGAEDGSEMGCYHHLHYVLREQATLDKLKEFLPVTQQPVLIVHSDWKRPVRKQE